MSFDDEPQWLAVPLAYGTLRIPCTIWGSDGCPFNARHDIGWTAAVIEHLDGGREYVSTFSDFKREQFVRLHRDAVELACCEARANLVDAIPV